VNLLKHYGPGPHPSGSPQSSHGGGDGPSDDPPYIVQQFFDLADDLDMAIDDMYDEGHENISTQMDPFTGRYGVSVHFDDEVLTRLNDSWNAVLDRVEAYPDMWEDLHEWGTRDHRALYLSALLTNRYGIPVDLTGLGDHYFDVAVQFEDLVAAYGILPPSFSSRMSPQYIEMQVQASEAAALIDAGYDVDSDVPPSIDGWGGVTLGNTGDILLNSVYVNNQPYGQPIRNDFVDADGNTVRHSVITAPADILIHEYGHLVMHAHPSGYIHGGGSTSFPLAPELPGQLVWNETGAYASSSPEEYLAEMFASHWKAEQDRYSESNLHNYLAIQDWSRDQWQADNPPSVTDAVTSPLQKRWTSTAQPAPGRALLSPTASRNPSLSEPTTPSHGLVTTASSSSLVKRQAKDPAFPHGPSIKWPKVYEALRREGHDKSSAAAISNAHWNKYRRWGRAGDPGPRSAKEYEATRGRKARRRKGIPLPKSRRKPITKRELAATLLKHYGPGEHPGTGTSQDVHGSGGGSRYEVRPGDREGSWIVVDTVTGAAGIVTSDKERAVQRAAEYEEQDRDFEGQGQLFTPDELESHHADLVAMRELLDDLEALNTEYALADAQRGIHPASAHLVGDPEVLLAHSQSKAELLADIQENGGAGQWVVWREVNSETGEAFLRVGKVQARADALGASGETLLVRPSDGRLGNEIGVNQILDEINLYEAHISWLHADGTINRYTSGYLPTEEAAIDQAYRAHERAVGRQPGSNQNSRSFQDLQREFIPKLEAVVTPLNDLMSKNMTNFTDPDFIAVHAPEWQQVVTNGILEAKLSSYHYSSEPQRTFKSQVEKIRQHLWENIDPDYSDFEDTPAFARVLMAEALGTGYQDYELYETGRSGLQDHLGIGIATEYDAYNEDDDYSLRSDGDEIDDLYARIEDVMGITYGDDDNMAAALGKAGIQNPRAVIARAESWLEDIDRTASEYRWRADSNAEARAEYEAEQGWANGPAGYGEGDGTTPQGNAIGTFAHDTFDGSYSNGFSVETYTDYNEVNGEIFKNGDKVGTFRFGLSGDHFNGDYMELDDRSVQGEGFATELLAHAYGPLIAEGYRSVSVSANMTVGGYSWAKLGLEWGRQPDYVRDRLRSIANLKVKQDPAGSQRLFEVTGQVIFPEEFQTAFRQMSGIEWSPEVELQLHKIIKPETITEARNLLDSNAEAQLTAYTGYQNRARIGNHEWHLGKMVTIGGSWGGHLDLDPDNNPLALAMATKPEPKAQRAPTPSIPSLTLRPPSSLDTGRQMTIYSDALLTADENPTGSTVRGTVGEPRPAGGSTSSTRTLAGGSSGSFRTRLGGTTYITSSASEAAERLGSRIVGNPGEPYESRNPGQNRRYSIGGGPYHLRPQAIRAGDTVVVGNSISIPLRITNIERSQYHPRIYDIQVENAGDASLWQVFSDEAIDLTESDFTGVYVRTGDDAVSPARREQFPDDYLEGMDT
jgi:hypothetical protein